MKFIGKAKESLLYYFNNTRIHFFEKVVKGEDKKTEISKKI